jgi:hypothetical protein
MPIKFCKELLAVTITLVGAIWLFMHNDANGVNSAAIFQGGSGNSTIEVTRSNGLTIIERRDRGGNSATIIQQDHDESSSN